MIRRPTFTSQADYAAHFTDLPFWRPYLTEICQRHQLPYTTIRAGLPGTNVVFLIDQQYAIKLYPDLFGGTISFATEQRCYELLASAARIPAPKLIASGQLFHENDGWHWPYLITTMLPGHSVGEAGIVSVSDRLALATWLGTRLRHIHALPLDTHVPLTADWNEYVAFLTAQRTTVTERQLRWGNLSAALCSQLMTYVPPPKLLIDQSTRPHLLHGDLNRDHVLGEWIGEHWQPTGIIDFGDARVGDPMYDLVAIHVGLFDGDKRLLRACLQSYGSPALQADLPHRAMALTLLHEFAILDGLRHIVQQASTLHELADLLWNIETPGLHPYSI